jgi:hypothetical protein
MPRARATASAANFLPEELALPALREAAAGCKGCNLWKLGTISACGPRSSDDLRFVVSLL